jgi:hypothetical protein
LRASNHLPPIWGSALGTSSAGDPRRDDPSSERGVFPRGGLFGMSLWELSPLDTCVVDYAAGPEIASHAVE